MSASKRSYRAVFASVAFGQSIRSCRKQAGLTCLELAQMIGVSNSTISYIENAVPSQTVNMQTFLELCNLFDLSPSFYFSLEVR